MGIIPKVRNIIRKKYTYIFSQKPIYLHKKRSVALLFHIINLFLRKMN